MPATIARLSPKLRDRIAAGEVVQRPASVLKELIENSLDAGATKIDIVAKRGGMDLLQVADNGWGIGQDQFELAVENHATSKIHNTDDLEQISSLGFRGEALASICSAAVVSLHSRVASVSDGWCATSHPNQDTLQLQPQPRAVGTTVTVHELFEHIPARKKFLKAERTEASALNEVLQNYTLAYPDVVWKYTHNDKIAVDLPSQSARTRAAKALKLQEQDLIEVQESGPLFGYQLFGAQPQHTSARANRMFLFLNGRPDQRQINRPCFAAGL